MNGKVFFILKYITDISVRKNDGASIIKLKELILEYKITN